ncbi:hypothetical protein [Nitrincola sp. A-D6]|nr:hypothetical protein [Nitrincola sp. A-D6]
MNIEPIELNDEIEALLVGEGLPVSDLRSSDQLKYSGCALMVASSALLE